VLNAVETIVSFRLPGISPMEPALFTKSLMVRFVNGALSRRDSTGHSVAVLLDGDEESFDLRKCRTCGIGTSVLNRRIGR
jgi:hypothetical protein